MDPIWIVVAFGPVTEHILTFPRKRAGKLLDLDTNSWATIKEFGADDRKTHARIRETGVDLSGGMEHGGVGLLFMDASVVELATDQWDTITPNKVVDNWALAQNEPQPITMVAEADPAKLPKACMFETREGSLGVLQIVGADEKKTGAKIRYKLVKLANGDPAAEPSGARPVKTLSGQPLAFGPVVEQTLSVPQGQKVEVFDLDESKRATVAGFNAQSELAQRFFYKVLTLDPQDAAGYKKSAEFNIALYDARSNGNPDKLAKYLESETDMERLRIGYLSLARVYEGKDDVPNALRVYETALEKFPDDAGIMNACAWFIYEQKAQEHFAWGIELAEKAVQLEPKEASIWDTLAWLLHSDGKYEKAIEAMTKCAELEPDVEYFQQSLERMKNDLKNKS